MLRTPTISILELGTGNVTSTPLIQKIHYEHGCNKFYYEHHSQKFSQKEYQTTAASTATAVTPIKSTIIKTKTKIKQEIEEEKQQQQSTKQQNCLKENLTKNLLSSGAFTFRRNKKPKTSTEKVKTRIFCDKTTAEPESVTTTVEKHQLLLESNIEDQVDTTKTTTPASSSSSSSRTINILTTLNKNNCINNNYNINNSNYNNNNHNNNNNNINIHHNCLQRTSTPTTTSLSTIETVNTTLTSIASMSPTSQTPTRTSLFDSCHRKIRLIGGGPVAFLGGLVAKARRKERDGDQNSTDTKLYLEESVLERKLPEADLKALVDLPAGLDYNEWLASHTLALFEHVNLVYGTISEFCTPSGCPDMTGPVNRTYLWFDEKGKKTRVAAPQYIDYVMTFTQKTVSDESIFPTKYANEFPSSFESIARKILRLQFHVIAHLYAAHFREIALLGLHTHLNLTFAHLTALHRRFSLIDEKETDVLRDLEVALRLTDDTQSTDGLMGGGSNCGGGGNNSGAGSGNVGTTITNNSTTHYNSATVQLQQQQQQTNMALNSQQQIVGDDVNSLQTTTATIDGSSNVPPICTQPEPATKTTAAAVFGGGEGLIGGILGDLTSGEFGDTTHYCTSAVPSSSNNYNNGVHTNNAETNGGAGASHLNFTSNNNTNNNNNNNHNQYHHLHHHHHAHGHHHHHHHQHHLQHQQNSGLIQCNASNAPSSVNNTATVASTTSSANAAAAGATTTA